MQWIIKQLNRDRPAWCRVGQRGREISWRSEGEKKEHVLALAF